MLRSKKHFGECPMHSIFMQVKLSDITARIIVYFITVYVLINSLTLIEEVSGELILLCCSILSVTLLFIMENVRIYKSSQLSKWKKHLTIDMLCICMTLFYAFLTHLLIYNVGEIRFYDIPIYAIGITPYLIHMWKIFF